jgi:hypothetical protein
LAPDTQVPTLPLADPAPAVPALPGIVDAPPVPAAGNRVGRGIQSVMGSRGVALVGGVVLGLLIPAGLATVSDNPVIRIAERLIAFGGLEPKAFGTIGAALADARKGDIIQVPPGTYAEAITLPAGVELRAEKPGTVILVAPASASDWTAISAAEPGSTIRGLRIEGTKELPIARGIAVAGEGVVVDDVDFAGAIDVAVSVTGTNVVVRSSRFERLAGTSIRLEQDGATLRHNVFKAVEMGAPPAVQAVGGATAAFANNTFVHFPHVVDPESRTESLLGRDNFVILAAPKR